MTSDWFLRIKPSGAYEYTRVAIGTDEAREAEWIAEGRIRVPSEYLGPDGEPDMVRVRRMMEGDGQ